MLVPSRGLSEFEPRFTPEVAHLMATQGPLRKPVSRQQGREFRPKTAQPEVQLEQAAYSASPSAVIDLSFRDSRQPSLQRGKARASRRNTDPLANLDILLSQPRGFCAGVVRAIDIVEQALEVHGAPIYVVHEIVHNRHVVEGLREKGAIFVESPEEVPAGGLTVFSAHGVAREVFRQAEARGLRVLNATCPLVTKVHNQARRYHKRGYELIVVGHPGHPEVEGHIGQVEDPVHVLSTTAEVNGLVVSDPEKLAYVTQTTLSIDDTREVIEALRERFPKIVGPELADICYATQNRQNAVRTLEGEADLLLVVGSTNSSNSNRLVDLGRQVGIQAYLIDDAGSIDPEWLNPKTRVGVTAGASAPEHLVQEVVERLKEMGASSVKEMDGEPEAVHFPLPDLQEFGSKS